MRILLVAHGLPPSGLGGTELYVDALARRFAEAGDDDPGHGAGTRERRGGRGTNFGTRSMTSW